MSKIFLSHATEEHHLVVHLANYLEKNNLEAWYAPRNIMGGIDYDKEIIAAIKDCRAFVLLLSRNSDASEDVKTEVYHAVKFNKLVICLDVDEVEPENLSYLLGMRHRLNWLERRDETLAKLVHDIKMIPDPVSCETPKSTVKAEPVVATETQAEIEAVIKSSAYKSEAKSETKTGGFRKVLCAVAIAVVAVSCVILSMHTDEVAGTNSSVELQEETGAEINLSITSDTVASDDTLTASAQQNSTTHKRQKKAKVAESHTKPARGKGIVVNVPEDDYLNLRAQPTTRSSILAKLNNGDIIKVNSQYKKPDTGTLWYNITDEKTNTTGFVSSRYIKIY